MSHTARWHPRRRPRWDVGVGGPATTYVKSARKCPCHSKKMASPSRLPSKCVTKVCPSHLAKMSVGTRFEPHSAMHGEYRRVQDAARFNALLYPRLSHPIIRCNMDLTLQFSFMSVLDYCISYQLSPPVSFMKAEIVSTWSLLYARIEESCSVFIP